MQTKYILKLYHKGKPLVRNNMKNGINLREGGSHATNKPTVPYRLSNDVDTPLSSIRANYSHDNKYLSLNEFAIDLYANNQEILKAWKSSDNIIQHALAQIVLEVITGKILEEELL